MHHAKCQYSIVDHFNSILELEHYKDTFRTNYYFFTDKEIEIFEKDTNIFAYVFAHKDCSLTESNYLLKQEM